jgi:hypothetical protein
MNHPKVEHLARRGEIFAGSRLKSQKAQSYDLINKPQARDCPPNTDFLVAPANTLMWAIFAPWRGHNVVFLPQFDWSRPPLPLLTPPMRPCPKDAP